MALNEGASVSACLLCFNDAQTISEMVRRACTGLDELGVRETDGEVVVVDDGSADDSVARLEELARDEPRLRIVKHGVNRGYGGALRSAFGEASGEWVFYTDGDGQYDPRQLAMLGAAVQPGENWIQGYKGTRSDPLVRRVVGSIYGATMRRLFALPVRDVDCDFRLIRADALDRLELTSDSGAICVELVRCLALDGARPVELEVDHFERLHGRSQFFRPRRILYSLRDVAVLWWRLVLRPALGRSR